MIPYRLIMTTYKIDSSTILLHLFVVLSIRLIWLLSVNIVFLCRAERKHLVQVRTLLGVQRRRRHKDSHVQILFFMVQLGSF